MSLYDLCHPVVYFIWVAAFAFLLAYHDTYLDSTSSTWQEGTHTRLQAISRAEQIVFR